MNRFITVLTTLTFTFTVFAQAPITHFGSAANKKANHKNLVNPDFRTTVLKHAKKSDFKRIDSTTYYVWEPQVGQWVTETRLKLAYGNDGYPVLSSYYEDWGSGNFNLVYAMETNFNTDGKLASSLYKEWDEFNKKWVFQYRDTSVFDQSGNVIEYLYQEYAGGKFENNYRSNSIFNLDGLLIKLKSARWDKTAKAWVPITTETLNYDSKNRLVVSFDSTWNKNLSQWNLLAKDTFEYDGNGALIRKTGYAWNTNHWEESERTTYKVNQNGRMTERIDAERNGTTWDSTRLSKYGYDANGNPNLEEYSDWDNGQWVSNARFEYTYDAVEKVNPITLQLDIYVPDNDHYIVNLPLEEFDYIANGSGGWDKDYHEVYHYSDGVNASINTLSSENIKVFPNPSTGQIRIATTADQSPRQVIIRDLTGVLVFRTEVNSQNTIDVSHLSTGMYIVELHTAGNAYKTKLIKE